nr:curlin repeat-containing protein [uncultured Draconibacterium sp.]
MKKIAFLFWFLLVGGVVLAQSNITTIWQEGESQVAFSEQTGTLNTISIEQISNNPQFAWVFQSGEMEDETSGDITPGGESNQAVVDQTYSGDGNKSFLFQYGSFNKSYQKQNGNGNQFNFAGNFPENIFGSGSLPEDAVPNQDGDYHQLSQIAVGNYNQSWIYQAGRANEASQYIEGDFNETWTSQSGYQQSSEMIIAGNRNGSHYLEHEEGKFPHSDEEEESSEGHSGGNGKSGHSGGESEEGGMPDVIPPPHDEDHVFVPTVSVAIKQMGRGSRAEMLIDGDDNKAVIIQRGGTGDVDDGRVPEEDACGGHFADQDIYGDWNRIFVSQMGKQHTSLEYVNGTNNLVLSMQRGNSNYSDIDVIGGSNELGIDQKGKGNISVASIDGFFNGNFVDGIDEYAVKLVQEGKENYSSIQITGSYNQIDAHQGGGGISFITQNGDWNTAVLNQESIDNH